MKKVIIKEIDYKNQTYPTVGNYTEYHGYWLIEVSKVKGYVKNEIELKAVALHELIEMWLTEMRGIKDEDIVAWDKKFIDHDGEPGEIKGAPYFKEHKLANKIEKLFIKECQKKI